MQTIYQRYLIRIEGHVGLDFSTWLDQVSVQHTEDGQTILIGALPDQTALHGLLMRIRDLGLTLVEVTRIDKPIES